VFAISWHHLIPLAWIRPTTLTPASAAPKLHPYQPHHLASCSTPPHRRPHALLRGMGSSHGRGKPATRFKLNYPSPTRRVAGAPRCYRARRPGRCPVKGPATPGIRVRSESPPSTSRARQPGLGRRPVLLPRTPPRRAAEAHAPAAESLGGALPAQPRPGVPAPEALGPEARLPSRASSTACLVGRLGSRE
jgi:hypothetical protein